MPLHHGLDVKMIPGPEKRFERSPACVLGIGRIAWMICHPTFHGGQSEKQRHSQNLLMHFQQVTHRLLHSLHSFQYHLIEMGSALNEPGPDRFAGATKRHELHAGVAADSIFSYFSIFTDDIADIILFAYGDYDRDKLDSFARAKNFIAPTSRIGSPKYAGIRSIFLELDDEGSWYDLALKRKVGVRQRITHYEDVINFGGTRNDDGEPWRPTAYIGGPGGIENPTAPSDIIQIITIAFGLLFDWLDRIYEQIHVDLKSRITEVNATWDSLNDGSHFYAGSFMPNNPSQIPENYLFLPILQGSERFTFGLLRRIY
jgi:hypothetical protein